VHGGCCRRWRREKLIQQLWPTLADQRLRATSTQLRDVLGACTELNPVYRRLVKMALEELQLIEQQICQLDQEIASLLHQHQDAVQRLAEVPVSGWIRRNRSLPR
jgi:transposase